MAEQIVTKTCTKCKQTKPITHFFIDRSRKAGHVSRCRDCLTQYMRTYRKTEKNRQYRQSYGKLYRASHAGKEAIQRGVIKYRNKNPNKRNAQNAVKAAIRDGRMPKVNTLQCDCGKQAEEYHHYLGYEPEHWLDVLPICRSCHRIIHFTSPAVSNLR